MSKLAIIIPAYKDEFLAQTLDSFVKQTNNNFIIYIGDDNSPNNLYSIVQKYEKKLNIVYKKFENNLGSRSLTKQWERCIDMSSEEWIWLFSDDDIAASYCVESFYNRKNKAGMFYKFNTKIIDKNNNVLNSRYDSKNYSKNSLSSQLFIQNRLASNGFRSFAVEYIFHRDLYKKYHFIDFPLAWASDDATWLIYSLKNNNNIDILDCEVYWRLSRSNISSNVKDLLIINQKIEASKRFILWLKKISLEYNVQLPDKLLLKWISFQLASFDRKISFNEYQDIIKSLNLKILKIELLKYYSIIQYFYFKNKVNFI